MEEERVSRQIKGGLQSWSKASAMLKQLRQDGKQEDGISVNAE